MLYQFDKNLIIDFLTINLIYQKTKNIQQFLELKQKILEQELPKFILNGNDLLNIGINPKEIGQKLKKFQKIWIESEFKITKEELLKIE